VRFKLSNPTVFIIHFLFKVNLLNKVLGFVAGFLMMDHDLRATDFQQFPYQRIFFMLFLEVYAPDQIL
jgi:CCR4-NOT transcription complex subunit 1